MKNYSKIVSTLATIIGVCALVIGGVALNHANKVTSPRIEDHTIQTQDLAENLPVAIKLADGSTLQGNILTSGSAYSVRGTSIPNGYIKVQVKDNQFVFDPHTISVTSKMLENGSVTAEDLGNNSVNSAKIADGSIQTSDVNFNVLGSLNGITGGNVDLLGSEFVSVTPDYRNKKITIALTNQGLKNADLLDGLDSTYFTNASNINSGVLSSDRFSALADLQAEGALDFNAGTDLVTREQAFANFLTEADFSAYENLSADNRLDFTDNTDLVTKAQAYDHFLSKDGGELNGELVVNGDLMVNGTTFVKDILADYGQISVLESYEAYFDMSFSSYLYGGYGYIWDLYTGYLTTDELFVMGNLDVTSINGHSMDYYQNADNINAGTLDNARFSAYSNLETNNYLDFTDNVDLVTKKQLSDNYLSINGGMVAGDISALKIFTSANGDIDAVLSALLNDTNDIKTSLVALISGVDELTDRVDTLEGFTLNDRLAILEALNLATIDGRISSVAGDVAALQTKTDATNNLLQSLENRVEVLEDKVDQLMTDNNGN